MGEHRRGRNNEHAGFHKNRSIGSAENVLLTVENSTTVSPGSAQFMIIRIADLPREAQIANIKLTFKTLKSMEMTLESKIRGD